ncbi:nitrate- and nitrite sensing domain-containing protein [Streptomyces sp. NPDC002851]
MRAPVQMKRPRGKGTDGALGASRSGAGDGAARGEPAGGPGGAADGATPAGRRVRVRSRLVIAVAVVAAAIGAAGAPAIFAASAQLADSQELVTRAELTKDAVSLAHSLSDERDEVTAYIAAGRPRGQGPADSTADRKTRVDRQIAELRAEAPGGLRKDLDALADVRREARTGTGSATDAHEAYTDAIGELHALAERLAGELPPRAGAGARALADLDRAVEQAAATRGLLLAALAVPRDPAPAIDPITGLPQAGAPSPNTKLRDGLSAAAQQARVREQAALADFERDATDADLAKLRSTVTGPEVDRAVRYLARLTDQSTLSATEQGYQRTSVAAALSARVEQMRSVENTLATDRIEHLSQLRDDDVTTLELRIAYAAALLLLAVGIATAVARTLTRPLAVLRLGTARLAEAATADPADKATATDSEADAAERDGADEPIRFTGRNDEFAAVVRSVNALHEHAKKLRDRQAVLEGDRKHLIGQREKLADEREQLRAELAESAARLRRTRDGISATFVQLALRTLSLVERQLGVIEGLEDREQDPDRLATLFKLDHFATVMRRHSENLLVLAGAEHRHTHPGPIPLIDVLRAAVSEIERYERVRVAALPPHAHLAGFAADDISHLVAELMENATSFSPPDAQVEVSGWLLESGEVMLSVQDEGIGMTDDRLRELNARLGEFETECAAHEYGDRRQADGGLEDGPAPESGLGLGLYVVARLAGRYGARVQLREQKQGGVAAVVVLPKAILAAAPPDAVAEQRGGPAAGTSGVHLPGFEAEANSNVLDGRSVRTVPSAGTELPPPGDPLIDAAEATLRAADAEPRHADVPGPREPLDVPESHEPLDVPAAREPVDVPEEREDRDGREEREDLEEPEEQPQERPAAPAAPAERPAAGTSESDATDETGERGATDEPAADLATGRVAEPATNLATDLATEPALDLAAEPAPELSADPDEPAATHERIPDGQPERITDKGLPKRTPKLAAPGPAPAARKGAVDAEALRRRLGGFQRGAVEGRRDVAAELAEDGSGTNERERTGETTNQGDSTEEARS